MFVLHTDEWVICGPMTHTPTGKCALETAVVVARDLVLDVVVSPVVIVVSLVRPAHNGAFEYVRVVCP